MDAQCFWNAMINQGRLTKMGIKSRIVCGSLYFGNEPIYGHLSLKTKQQWARDYSISHCWVEDADGGIYDNLYNNYSKKGEFVGEIIGWTQRDIANLYDIHYYPAPKACQQAIWAFWEGEIDWRVSQQYDEEAKRQLTRDDFINTEHVWIFKNRIDARLVMFDRPVFVPV
jgi:hypothetical protein